MAKNCLVHFEYSCTDLDRTKGFLQGLFGWDFTAFGPDMYLFNPPEGPGGGLTKVEQVEPGNSPSLYIEVDDIQAYLEKAGELGGSVDVPRTEIPTVGFYAHVLDPDGSVIGLFEEPKEKK